MTTRKLIAVVTGACAVTRSCVVDLLRRTVWGVSIVLMAFAGAGVCLVWRLLALRLHWRAPMPAGPANV